MNILPFTICIFNCPPCVLYLAWPSINTTTFYFVNIYYVYVVFTSISYPTSLMTSFPLHLMAMALKLLLSFTSDSERMSSWRRKSVPTAAPAAAMLWRQVETRLDQAASGLQPAPVQHQHPDSKWSRSLPHQSTTTKPLLNKPVPATQLCILHWKSLWWFTSIIVSVLWTGVICFQRTI